MPPLNSGGKSALVGDTSSRTLLVAFAPAVRPKRILLTPKGSHPDELRIPPLFGGGKSALVGDTSSHALLVAFAMLAHCSAERTAFCLRKKVLTPTSYEYPRYLAGVLAHSLGIEPKFAAPEATVLSIILRVHKYLFCLFAAAVAGQTFHILYPFLRVLSIKSRRVRGMEHARLAIDKKITIRNSL